MHIEASTRRELRRIIKGLRKKFPQLRDRELEEILQEAQDKSFYSPDLIEILAPVASPEVGKAMVKSAVALAFNAGVDPKQCDLALDYLLREGREACFGYYYDEHRDIINNRPPGSLFHCVYVEGRSRDHTIVGYVELFSLLRVVLCLSQSYIGRDFTHAYTINPVSGNELDITVNFDLSTTEIRAAYDFEKLDEATYIDAVSKVFVVVKETEFNRALERVVNDAVRETIAAYGFREGGYMTDEQLWTFTQGLVDRVIAFHDPQHDTHEFAPGVLSHENG